MSSESRQADLAHREHVANLLLRQAADERRAREELARAEDSKEILMTRLAQLDLGLISTDSEIMDRVVYTVGSQCSTDHGREELSELLDRMDPEGMITLEIVGWCRSAYPFREVLPAYANFVRRARAALRSRLDVGRAESLMRGLP